MAMVMSTVQAPDMPRVERTRIVGSFQFRKSAPALYNCHSHKVGFKSPDRGNVFAATGVDGKLRRSDHFEWPVLNSVKTKHQMRTS